MSMYDLRQSIEYAVPWWVPIALAVACLAVYFVMEHKGK